MPRTEDACYLYGCLALSAQVTEALHLVFQGMPGIGVGPATNAATTAAPVVTTDTKTAVKTVAAALASVIEVVSSTPLASSPSTSLAPVSLFKCLHCQFTSKKKFNVKRHIRQQHDQQAVTCDGCNRRYRNQYYLQWYHKPKCPYTQPSTNVLESDREMQPVLHALVPQTQVSIRATTMAQESVRENTMCS